MVAWLPRYNICSIYMTTVRCRIQHVQNAHTILFCIFPLFMVSIIGISSNVFTDIPFHDCVFLKSYFKQADDLSRRTFQYNVPCHSFLFHGISYSRQNFLVTTTFVKRKNKSRRYSNTISGEYVFLLKNARFTDTVSHARLI